MEDSSSKIEAMKPVFLKAGIPLAISAAGFIISKIISNRRSNLILDTPVSFLEIPDHSLDSASSTSKDHEEHNERSNSYVMQYIGSSEIHNKNVSDQEEIIGLRTRIEELQKKELELGTQFLRYCDLKEQESMLLEIKNMFILETAYLESINREVSSMEVEMKRAEFFLEEFYKVLGQLEHWKSENRLLQIKVKKLSRKTTAQLQIIREKDLKITAKEAEILRNFDSLEERSNVVKKLEDEVMELQSFVDQIQEQKSELLDKLNLMEKNNSDSSNSKDDAYKQLEDEYEQLQKVREAEVTEIIYLRWSNACLRHELMRYHAQKEDENEKNKSSEHEFERSGQFEDFGMEQHLNGLVLEQPGSHVGSRRKKLMKKFKKWVEGGERSKPRFEEKEKYEANKSFGRHSVYDILEVEEDEESIVHARKSFSSV